MILQCLIELSFVLSAIFSIFYFSLQSNLYNHNKIGLYHANRNHYIRASAQEGFDNYIKGLKLKPKQFLTSDRIILNHDKDSIQLKSTFTQKPSNHFVTLYFQEKQSQKIKRMIQNEE